MRCFSPLLGLKVSTFRAVISMLSPVWGLRPRRDAFWRIRKCPKPTIFTSSPFSKQLKMMSKTDSTTDDDCRLESPCAATAFTRSFFVTVTPHPLSRTGFVSLVSAREYRLVAARPQLLQRRLRGRPIAEAADPHAMQRRAGGRLPGSGIGGGGACSPH